MMSVSPIETLPADLFGGCLLFLRSDDAFTLSTASDALIDMAAHTIAPWEEGNTFGGTVWYLHESPTTALLRARNSFVSVASSLDTARWPFGVAASPRVSDDQLKMVAEDLTEVTSLSLRSALNLTELGFLCLPKLLHLTSLKVTWCHALADAGLGCIAQLTQLTSLAVNYSRNVRDSGVALLSTLVNLTSLDLTGCDEMSDAGLIACISSMRSLHTLYLCNCSQITDAALHEIAMHDQVVALDFRSCAISSDGVVALRGLRGLQQLLLPQDVPKPSWIYRQALKYCDFSYCGWGSPQ